MSVAYFQELIESIENLPLEDQDYLFELIHKRRIEKRRLEIANNAEQIIADFHRGEVKKGTAEEIKAYLLEDEEE